MKSYEGNAALCVIATGLGKTRIFAEYIRCDVLENDHHILILSHREELVIQPLEYLKGLPCGIEQGTTHAHGEPIISASVQSLVGRLDKYNPYSIDTIIIDEAHHAITDGYQRVLEHFPEANVLGVTPTKGSLMAIQKSLSLSTLGFELLDRKRNILIREMMLLIDKVKSLRGEISSTYREAYEALQEANVTLGMVQELSLIHI